MSYYYSYTLTHPGLGKSRVIKADTRSELQQKVDAQAKIWNDLYARQREANARRQVKANKTARVEEAQEEAEARTREAQQILQSIRTILAAGTGRRLSFSWDDKRSHFPYPAAQPEVVYRTFPPQPEATDPAFTPLFGMLDKLVGSLHDQKVAASAQLYQQALTRWQDDCIRIGQANDLLETDYLKRMAKWKSEKQAYEQAQAAARAAAELKLQRYLSAAPSEVVEYNTKIVEQSIYPDFFEKSFDLDYQGLKRVLTVNYDLCAFSDFPKLDSVKYVKTKDTFTESWLSVREATALYASFVFQVGLRTIREIFDADKGKVVSGIAFNGYVSATNPATGNVDRTCVLALNATPEAFAQLNLAKVDPEECFKALGGRASEPLNKYRPVAPASAEANPVSSASHWVEPLTQRLKDNRGTVVFRVKELQDLLEIQTGSRANLGDSRGLVASLAEAGFALEPDASLLAEPYRPTDAVALFIPQDSADITTSPSYQGAAAVLAMCGLVAVADGRLEPYEVDRTRQCVEEAFKLTPGDGLRFNALLQALLVDSDCLWRALPKVIGQLKPEFREWAVEVAVYVGVKNGALEPVERRILDRIFEAINLPKETEARIIARYTATSPEVTVMQADPQPVGEVIARASSGLKLDMSRVAAIAQETREVVAKLAGIMEDKEAEAPPVPITVSLPLSVNSPVLNSHYLAVYQEIITQPKWSRADFNQLVGKHQLMPIAVTDIINAWADDTLGDFLIEGEDPIIIHIELLPQNT